MPPKPKPALTKAPDAGVHPAVPRPSAPPAGELRAGPPGLPAGEPTVMFSVRVPASLRQEVKLEAVRRNTTVEKWVEEALRRHLAGRGD